MRGGARLASLAFPLIVALGMTTLVALDVNGSSVGVLSVADQPDPSLLAGTPRGIRSDEAALSTPNFVGNIRRGLPVAPWIGLTPTFLPATSIGVVSDHWTEAFKPQDWGAFVLRPDRAFAWHWWAQLAIAMLGLYALLVTLTRRRWTSAGLAVVGALSPYVAWWSLTPGLTLGFAAGTGALALAALRARTLTRAVLLGAASGWAAVAGFLLLYPPWQISIGWVLVGLLVGAAADARARLSLLPAAGAAFVVVVVALGGWYLQSRTALAATTGTIYPGDRLVGARQGNISWLFDSAASPYVAAQPEHALRGLSALANGHLLGGDQSKVAAAWLPLPLLLLLVVAVVVVHRRRAGNPDDPQAADRPPLLWTTVGVSAAGLLLLAWTLAPLPSFVGQVTLLDRVPGTRTSLALGLVATVLLAIGSASLRGVRWSWRWWVAWVCAVALTVWLTTWAARALPWGTGQTPVVWGMLGISAGFGIGFALVGTGRLLHVTLTLLMLGSIATWAVVNPWYRGLGPLTADPLVRAMIPLAQGPHPARVAVYGSGVLDALVASSGVVTLSGLTVYPDADVWRTLAPTQRAQWNNYSQYGWVADPYAAPASIPVPTRSTAQELLINPCAPQTLALHIDWVVSGTDLPAYPCLRRVDAVQRGGYLIYRYRVVAP